MWRHKSRKAKEKAVIQKRTGICHVYVCKCACVLCLDGGKKWWVERLEQQKEGTMKSEDRAVRKEGVRRIFLI